MQHDSVSPLRIGQNLILLTPQTLESALKGANVYTAEANGFSARAIDKGIFVDISRVQWLDIGALAQLLLLLEAAHREEIPITVAMPTPHLTHNEIKWIEESKSETERQRLAANLRQRQQVRSFLKTLQFESALRFDHHRQGNIPGIIQDYDPSLPLEELQVQPPEMLPDDPAKQPRHKYCFPLRWVKDNNATVSKRMARFLTTIVGHPERGLEEIDASSISNVFLFELIQNVTQHAGEEVPALVAAWARPAKMPPTPDHYLQAEQAYFQWFAGQHVPLVEILVGDSGIGVVEKLRPAFDLERKRGRSLPNLSTDQNANILAWAVERWSTSRTDPHLRGTRGLYRVDRVASKYDGILSLRSSTYLFVRDHGGPGVHSSGLQKKLRQNPGTLLRLRIPPFREKLPSRLEFRDSIQIKPIFVNLDQLTPNGLCSDAHRRLRNAIQDASTSKNRYVLASFSGGVEKYEAIVAALEEAARLRHPAALVLVGLPGGWNLVETAIDSINKDLERVRRDRETKEPEHYQVLDPVLVVGPNLQTAWVGASTETALVLDMLLNSETGACPLTELRELLPSGDQRREVIQRLREDAHLTKMIDSSVVQIALSVHGILDSATAHLREQLLEAGPGVNEGPWITPSLCRVRVWIDIDKWLRAEVGSVIPIHTLADKIRRHEEHTGREMSLLLYDTTVGDERLNLLRDLLGNIRTEPMLWEAAANRDVEMVRPGEIVTFFTEIITSGEATTRALATILRNGAQVSLVACLIDGRENSSSEIEVWGKKFPVITLVREPILLSNEAFPESGVPIDPITKEAEDTTPPELKPTYPISPQDMYKLVTDSEALHFSHIGRKVGRHFTFYIDVPKICSHPLILRSIDDEITQWIGRSGDVCVERDVAIEIWYPSTHDERDHPAGLLAEEVQSHRKDVTEPRPIRRVAQSGRWVFPLSAGKPVSSPNLFIIDWGTLTGANLTELVRRGALAGANRILACIVVSQLSEEREHFYRSIDRIAVRRRGAPVGNQKSLPGLAFSRTQEETASVEIRVRFLSRMQIGAYNSNTCPICLQRRRLAGLEAPPNGLAQFEHDQESSRLRLRSRQEVLELPEPLDLDGRALTRDIVTWMILFRERLEAAATSTVARLEIASQLLRIEQSQDFSTSHDLTEGLALIRFLSIEVQWLQRAPLSFRFLRNVIGRIALAIACNKNADDEDRKSAVIALRTSSKMMFADSLSTLLLEALPSHNVTVQILYAVSTFLSRPYLVEEAGILRRLRGGLIDARQKAREAPVGFDPELQATLESVVQHIDHFSARANINVLTLPVAWARLREMFMEDRYFSHAAVPEHFRYLQPGPDIYQIGAYLSGSVSVLDSKVKEWIQHLPNNWSSCGEFLDRDVLPLVRRLETVFRSPDALKALGTEEAHRLVRLSKLPHPISKWRFSTLLESLARDPEGTLSDVTWNAFLSQLHFLWDIVFAPRMVASSGEIEEESRLIAFLRSCPVSASNAIPDIVAEIEPKNQACEVSFDFEDPGDRYSVFATRDLLWGVFAVLLGNCEKHRKDERHKVHVNIQVKRRSPVVELVVSNDNTQESHQPGRGLRQLHGRLENFGGFLSSSLPRANPKKTFEVRILLLES